MTTPKKPFISYSHKQGDWVWDRLVPVLRAGGVEPLLDKDRFKAGLGVLGQMDRTQDQSDLSVLCLSADYYASQSCQHEMDRAIASDPHFANGTVIPVRLDDAPLPASVGAPDPIWVDMRKDSKSEPWRMLMDSCGSDFGTGCAVRWLDARDRVRQLVERGKSVCLLVTDGQPRWRELLNAAVAELPKPVRTIDLDAGSTKTRVGFINAILGRPARAVPANGPGGELVELHEEVSAMSRPLTVVLDHFDHMSTQFRGDADLFGPIRHLIMDQRKLVLVVQTRTPFARLLPSDHQLSSIDITTVELS